MKPHSLLLVCLGLCFFLVSACGGCSKQKDETISQEESNDQQNSADSDDPAADLNQAVNQMQNAMKNLQEGETVEVVDFRKLKEMMPESLAGLKRSSNTGQKAGAMGFNMSQAEAVYEEGDKKIEVSIIDVGGLGMAMAGIAAWSTLEMDRESDDEYERTTMYNGQKAFEKYNKKTRSGEYNMIVDSRYVVSIKGRNVEERDLDRARKGIDLGDLKKLQ